MRPKITRTYEMPVPSGVKVAYTEGSNGLTISDGLSTVYLHLDFISELGKALKAIRMTKAKEEADGIVTDD